MVRGIESAAVAVATAGALLVGGCSFLPPQADPTRYYVLTPVVASAERMQAGDVRLSVGPVVLPSYLDRPAIAVRRAQNRLEIEEHERWAEPLPAAFSRVLEQNLVALLGSDAISSFPFTAHAQEAPQYVLRVDVLRFEPTAQGRAELSARWWLKDVRTRATVLSRETVASRAVASRDTAAAVEALSQCVADLSREIAQALVLRGRSG